MNIDKFCQEANKNPIFKKRLKIEITPSFLKKVGFVRDVYFVPNDIIALSYHLTKLENESDKKELLEKEKNLTERELKAKKKILSIIYPDIYFYKKGLKEKGSVSLITILRLIPKFEIWVTQSRKQYKIKPAELKLEIFKKFEDDFPAVVEMVENEYLWWYDFILQTACNTKRKNKSTRTKEILVYEIEKWLEKKFSGLDDDIREFCISQLKLPISAIPFVKKYMLYEKIEWNDVLPNSVSSPIRPAMIKTKKGYTNFFKNDIKDFEPHINIKLYGGTDIDALNDLVRFFSKTGMLRKLPSYKSKMGLARQKPQHVLLKAIYFFLITGERVSPIEANGVLKNLDLKTVPVCNSWREINRFRTLLGLQ